MAKDRLILHLQLILALCLLMLLHGCGIHFSGHPEHTSEFNYSTDSHGSWRVFQHKENDWGKNSHLPYLNEVFSTSDRWKIDRRWTRNTFLAEYASPDVNIAVYVATGGYMQRKGVDTDFFDNILSERTYDNSEFCKSLNKERVIVAFNAVEVDFKSDSVKFEMNKATVLGEEIASYFNGAIVQAETYPSNIYNLASLKGVSRFEPSDVNESFNHPTFTYRFTITCTDFENSIFIIDGLYYKGKQIPPLRVRLNYYDFSKVPQYEGKP